MQNWVDFLRYLDLHIIFHVTCKQIVLPSRSGLNVYFNFMILCDPFTCNPKSPNMITLEIRLTVARHLTGYFYLLRCKSVASVMELHWLTPLPLL